MVDRCVLATLGDWVRIRCTLALNTQGHFASYTSNFTCQALTLFGPVSMSPLLFDSIREKYQVSGTMFK